MKTKEEIMIQHLKPYQNGISDTFKKFVIDAMEQYAIEYHESKVKNLNLSDVSANEVKYCDHRHIMWINSEIGHLCLECKKFSANKQHWH